MSRPRPTPEREPWPPPWARTISFFVGIGLIVWETVIDQAAHLIVYGPAFALTGLPIARGVERMINVIAGLFSSQPSEGE
jgi:hypothetical protein